MLGFWVGNVQGDTIIKVKFGRLFLMKFKHFKLYLFYTLVRFVDIWLFIYYIDIVRLTCLRLPALLPIKLVNCAKKPSSIEYILRKEINNKIRIKQKCKENFRPFYTYLPMLARLKEGSGDDYWIAGRRTSLLRVSIMDLIASSMCFCLYFYSLIVSFSITVFFVLALISPFQILIDTWLYSCKEILKAICSHIHKTCFLIWDLLIYSLLGVLSRLG